MGASIVDQRLVPWKALNEGAKEPTYGTPEAAGADLYANLTDGEPGIKGVTASIPPGHRLLVKTGVSIELPTGTYAKIEGRSGLAYKHGIAVLGGVIDSDYRGDIGVILLNTGDKPFLVNHGDRIAQLIIQPYIAAAFTPFERLEGSDRGEAGFGSTGA